MPDQVLREPAAVARVDVHRRVEVEPALLRMQYMAIHPWHNWGRR